MSQGLGMNVDVQISPTNVENEVEGQQGLERVVEEIGPTNLDNKVESVGQLPLSPRWILGPFTKETSYAQALPTNMEDEVEGQ